VRKIQCETCPVRGEGIICDLPLDALDDFRAASSPAVYRPRQVVFSEGNPANGLFLVCHGSVKLYHADRFGREHILEIAGPGAVLGELSLDDGQTLSVSAESLTDAQLSYLPRDRLQKFLEKYPGAGMRLIAALSNELAAARRKARDLALKGAESRLAILLLDLARTSADAARVHIRFTRRELGEMIGVSTETVIRLLTKLRQKGVIRMDRRELVIADLERLKQVATHDDIAA